MGVNSLLKSHIQGQLSHLHCVVLEHVANHVVNVLKSVCVTVRVWRTRGYDKFIYTKLFSQKTHKLFLMFCSLIFSNNWTNKHIIHSYNNDFILFYKYTLISLKKLLHTSCFIQLSKTQRFSFLLCEVSLMFQDQEPSNN